MLSALLVLNTRLSGAMPGSQQDSKRNKPLLNLYLQRAWSDSTYLSQYLMGE